MLKTASPSGTWRISIVFLQGVIVCFGLAVLAMLLVEPHFEGRNTNSTVFDVYFKDPFLAFVYIGSIPFFFGLYHGLKLLGAAGRGIVFVPTANAARSLKIIKWCAVIVLAFVAISVLFLFTGDPEDRPPGVMLRILVTLPTLIVAVSAGLLQRIVQSAVDLKAENDLTV